MGRLSDQHSCEQSASYLTRYAASFGSSVNYMGYQVIFRSSVNLNLNRTGFIRPHDAVVLGCGG